MDEKKCHKDKEKVKRKKTKKNPLGAGRPKFEFTPEESNIIINLYKNGISLNVIAEYMEIPANTLSYRMKSTGLTTKCKRARLERNFKIIEGINVFAGPHLDEVIKSREVLDKKGNKVTLLTKETKLAAGDPTCLRIWVKSHGGKYGISLDNDQSNQDQPARQIEYVEFKDGMSSENIDSFQITEEELNKDEVEIIHVST